MLSKEEYLAFFKGLQDYQYFDKNGRLDLEDFCVTLSACMMHDGTGLREARPENFHRLWLMVLEEKCPEKIPKWIQSQRLVDWTPQLAFLYPTGQRTCVHMAALIMHGVDWISRMGSNIFRIPDEEWRPEYFGWVKEEWYFTHTFLNGYHDAIFSLMKEIDIRKSKAGEVSKFEALRLASKENTGYDDAVQKLEIRNKAWGLAIDHIKHAIEAGFYLEAVSVTENVISNLLHHWLVDKKNTSQDLSFHALLQQVHFSLKKKDDLTLMDSIDQWRKYRNIAIHKYVTTSIEELSSNQIRLNVLTKQTAMNGLQLMQSAMLWYQYEATNFIDHRFPRQSLDS